MIKSVVIILFFICCIVSSHAKTKTELFRFGKKPKEVRIIKNGIAWIEGNEFWIRQDKQKPKHLFSGKDLHQIKYYEDLGLIGVAHLNGVKIYRFSNLKLAHNVLLGDYGVSQYSFNDKFLVAEIPDNPTSIKVFYFFNNHIEQTFENWETSEFWITDSDIHAIGTIVDSAGKYDFSIYSGDVKNGKLQINVKIPLGLNLEHEDWGGLIYSTRVFLNEKKSLIYYTNIFKKLSLISVENPVHENILLQNIQIEFLEKWKNYLLWKTPNNNEIYCSDLYQENFIGNFKITKISKGSYFSIADKKIGWLSEDKKIIKYFATELNCPQN